MFQGTGQQVSDPVHGMIGDPRQDVAQVCLGIESVEFAEPIRL
jgi:hypothetical protein